MRQPEETKALKVKLPVHQHIKLRTLKLLSDHTMSEIVEQAVADYIKVLEEEGGAAADAIASAAGSD